MDSYLNTTLEDLEGEVWADAFGFDGIYEVSNKGRLKSLERWVRGSNGGERRVNERILKQHICKKDGQPTVKLSVEGISKTNRISMLVGIAFVGEKKEGEEYCHLDKVKTNNNVENIEIKTHNDSKLIGYDRGVRKNWGIESVHKKNREEYLSKNGTYKDDNLVSMNCTKCGTDTKMENFYKGRICKECVLDQLGVKEIGKLRERKDLAKRGLRYCAICKELKTLATDYGNNKKSFMGKTNTCKCCVKKLNAKYKYKAKQVK